MKMLGPTAEYIGGGVQDWTERRVQNVQRVLGKAQRKLLPGEVDEPGGVPPRVLKGVLEEAQFADDELVAEYLGGVLASSRSENGRDDRAATYSALIGRLSTYQLRLHYALYESARRALAGEPIKLSISHERERDTKVFWPFDAIAASMAFSTKELQESPEIIKHSLHGFRREELIADTWAMGPPQLLRQHAEPGGLAFPSTGLVVSLSPMGIGLFVIAHGKKTGDPLDQYLRPDEPFLIEIDVDLAGGVTPIKHLPPYTPDSA